jgi:GGDEF domain-containing protein
LEAKLQLAVERQLALERRGLDPAAQVALLHRAAVQLDSLEEEELFPAILAILAEQLDVDAAEVYAVEPTGLAVRAARGGAEVPARRLAEVGLIGLALQERRVVSARDLLAHPELVAAREETVIAAPLLSRTGEPLGVVNVRSLPFARLTPSTIRVVEMLTNWGARALERARLVRRLRPTDPRLSVHTYAHFCERLASEFWRSKRYEQPLSLLLFTMIECDAVAPDCALRLRQTVAQLLLRLVRTVDLVACYRDVFGFAVLLPATDRSGALALRDRVVQTVERFQLQAPGEGGPLTYLIGAASLAGDMASPADLERLAEDVAAAPDLSQVDAGPQAEGS